ncbi:DUF6441 family protein [Sphingomonas sp. AX6]|uniref:DUF6441 family protein n=1 Tax=Sphingomonas sp. AX6 TaxID=2653171 RepID=UPI0012F0B7B1|nr:DUF6441 family protein [Sphingomonas sp. AX6]VXC63429.1 conserved hypothetical protein [Sphingomonas sp. AX6]
MKISVDLPGLRQIMQDVEGDISTAATEAMRGTSRKALLELRRQVTGAGLSQRLANTWRDRVYPERRRSMTPTGYIWSNAPDIIDGYARGATIMPLAGKRFLAIPTKSVPMARRQTGRSKRVPMSPAEVEHAFNQDLFYKRGRAGQVLAFLNAVRSKNRRTVRAATKGRARQGRTAEPILMFVLVPSVKVPRLFDLDATARRWADNYAAEFERRLEGR